MHELKTADFSILSYYAKKDNLSRFIRGIRVDVFIADDVPKP